MVSFTIFSQEGAKWAWGGYVETYVKGEWELEPFLSFPGVDLASGHLAETTVLLSSNSMLYYYGWFE